MKRGFKLTASFDTDPSDSFLAGLEEGYLERDTVEKMATGVGSSDDFLTFSDMRQSYSAESAINTARASFKERLLVGLVCPPLAC